MLLVVIVTYIPTSTFANSYDDQGEALMEKIIPLIKGNNSAGALPYMAELEKLGPKLSSPLPESYHYYYIDCLDKAGESAQALNRSKVFLKKYGKKGKYSSRVKEISTRLKGLERTAKLAAEKNAAEAKRQELLEKKARAEADAVARAEAKHQAQLEKKARAEAEAAARAEAKRKAEEEKRAAREAFVEAQRQKKEQRAKYERELVQYNYDITNYQKNYDLNIKSCNNKNAENTMWCHDENKRRSWFGFGSMTSPWLTECYAEQKLEFEKCKLKVQEPTPPIKPD